MTAVLLVGYGVSQRCQLRRQTEVPVLLACDLCKSIPVRFRCISQDPS